MSKREKNGYGNCLTTNICGTTIWLHRSFDLVHGIGWFCHTYFENRGVGFGFHKTNKFIAVRQALINNYK